MRSCMPRQQKADRPPRPSAAVISARSVCESIQSILLPPGHLEILTSFVAGAFSRTIGNALSLCLYALSNAKPLRTFAGNALVSAHKTDRTFDGGGRDIAHQSGSLRFLADAIEEDHRRRPGHAELCHQVGIARCELGNIRLDKLVTFQRLLHASVGQNPALHGGTAYAPVRREIDKRRLVAARLAKFLLKGRNSLDRRKLQRGQILVAATVTECGQRLQRVFSA